MFGVELEGLSIGLDGGALISDGHGLCASTQEYFQWEGIDLGDEDLRRQLLAQLGCATLVLVPTLIREPTRHIDMIAQFLAPDRVAVAQIDDPIDGPRLDVATERLVAAARARGVELQVVRVPMVAADDGEYRSYVNSLRLRRTLLVPTYLDVPPATELDAYEALSSALPEVTLVPVAADEMIRLRGALHCVSLGLGRRPLALAREHDGPARP